MQENIGINIVMRRSLNRCAVTVFAILTAIISVGCGDRENILTIEKPTEVYAITQVSSAPDPNMHIQLGKVIATLKSGETAKAIGVYHGEDHDGFKVKLADGTEGIILAGDTFRVMSQ